MSKERHQLFPVYKIRLDGGTQPRLKTERAVVESYKDAMIAGAKFPPIDLFFDGEDYWPGDGHYRIAAAKAAGKAKILATIHSGTSRAAWIFSLRANAVHGQPLSRAEKRRATQRVLKDKEWAQWSDHAIARHIGVSHLFVGSVRRGLTRNVSSQTKRIGLDNRIIKTANIGKSTNGISARTARRDAREREAETVELLELARELASLANRYPRFARKLNQLVVHVRWQASQSHVKRSKIVRALLRSPLTTNEICEETLLDNISANTELIALRELGEVENCEARGASECWRLIAPGGGHTEPGPTDVRP
jgi:hypothetical protein